MKFSTAKLRNNLDFSKLLAFIFTIWCFFTLFFYHLTHGRNRNEVFSAGLSAISISVISVFREPSWGTYKMRKMVWVNKKASSQRRESFFVIVYLAYPSRLPFFHQGYTPLPYPMRHLLAWIGSSRPKLANRSSHSSYSSLSP